MSIKRQDRGGIASWIVLVSILLLVGLAWVKRQEIYDWSRLRDYDPPQRIQQLAFDTTMTRSATRLFYVYHPELNGRKEFNSNCSGFGEQTIVLGCYISNKGIFLFKIDDKRLDGVEQVTAAHEMLHAAYDRLSLQDRQWVDKITGEVLHGLKNERIKQTIENYRMRDAATVANEIHSIFGTELRDLPPELEEYYKRYFVNRQAIVAYSERYETVLTSRRNRAASLELQISGLKNEIEQLEKTLQAEKDLLISSRSSVHTVQEADEYNNRVAAYNENINLLNAQISKHNKLVEEYQSVALETQELYKALDSRPKL